MNWRTATKSRQTNRYVCRDVFFVLYACLDVCVVGSMEYTNNEKCRGVVMRLSNKEFLLFFSEFAEWRLERRSKESYVTSSRS